MSHPTLGTKSASTVNIILALIIFFIILVQTASIN